MNKLDLLKRVLISMTSQELAKVEEMFPTMLPMIRQVVLAAEDQESSFGLIDIQHDWQVDTVLSELDDDLERFFRRLEDAQG